MATPLIAHWPAGIGRRAGVRRDVGHVVDVVPTLYELATGQIGPPAKEVRAPELPGRSLVPALKRGAAVEREFLYFHHDGNRALRMGDWKLVSGRPRTNQWSLYNLASDRTEMHDLAAQFPERVTEMATRWESLEREYRREAVEGMVGKQ